MHLPGRLTRPPAAAAALACAAVTTGVGAMAIPTAFAQGGPPPGLVRYTEAREHSVRGRIRLPGSVEARTSGLVASEIAGLVTRLHVREGDVVRKGAPIARLDTDALRLDRDDVGARMAEAESRLERARISLERARSLLETEIVSQQDFDNANYEFLAWKGRVDSLTAQLARIERSIAKSTIRAPFGGHVVAERTELGEWLVEGAPVVELMSLVDLEVRVAVPERYYSSLNPGAPATVTFDAVPDYELTGRISAIVPRAHPQARTFPVTVKLPETKGRIGVSMLAQVAFTAGEEYRATIVPKDAIVHERGEAFVFRLSNSGGGGGGGGNGDAQTIERLAVRTGQGVGGWVVVEGGLKAGERVVTRGNERLFPGMPVRGEPLEYDLP